jgi:hypothetical protein
MLPEAEEMGFPYVSTSFLWLFYFVTIHERGGRKDGL